MTTTRQQNSYKSNAKAKANQTETYTRCLSLCKRQITDKQKSDSFFLRFYTNKGNRAHGALKWNRNVFSKRKNPQKDKISTERIQNANFVVKKGHGVMLILMGTFPITFLVFLWNSPNITIWRTHTHGLQKRTCK